MVCGTVLCRSSSPGFAGKLFTKANLFFVHMTKNCPALAWREHTVLFQVVVTLSVSRSVMGSGKQRSYSEIQWSTSTSSDRARPMWFLPCRWSQYRYNTSNLSICLESGWSKGWPSGYPIVTGDLPLDHGENCFVKVQIVSRFSLALFLSSLFSSVWKQLAVSLIYSLYFWPPLLRT